MVFHRKGDGLSKITLAIFIALALVAVGILIYKREHKPTQSQISLVITQQNPYNDPNVTSFTKMVSESWAKIIYNDVASIQKTQKPYPPNTVLNCPYASSEYRLDLQFRNPNLDAVLDLAGCTFLHVNNSSYWATTQLLNDVAGSTGEHEPGL
jgi:hypothetical protein